jgi:hypothetical protein
MYSVVIIKNHYTAGHYDGDVFVPGTSVKIPSASIFH